MKYRSVRGTELAVSEICLGTMTFGSPVAKTDAVRLIHHALGHGVNFIDTANMYEGYARVPGSAGGVAEEIIGAALKDVRRSDVVLATKVGMKVGKGGEDEFTSPAAIRKQLDASLRRLNSDYIDIYYLHKADPHTAPEELLAELERAVKSGKIRYYAVSNYSLSDLQTLVNAAHRGGFRKPAMCQPPLSLLKQDSLNDLLPYCVREDISVVPYQILQGGLLSGKYKRGQPLPANSRKAEKPDWVGELDSGLFDMLESLEAIAAAQDLSLTQYAIAWCLRQPGVVSAIIGVKNERQIDEAVAAIEAEGSE